MTAVFNRLSTYLNENTPGPRFIFVPFIQKNALEKLLSDKSIPTTIVTRWNTDDLQRGVSDPYIYDVCTEHGWTLKLHPKIHLKAYCQNFESAYIGSANLTETGLGLSEYSTVELMSLNSPLEPDAEMLLLQVLATSKKATRDIYDWAKKQYRKPGSNRLYPPPFDTVKDFSIINLPASPSPQIFAKNFMKYVRGDLTKEASDTYFRTLMDAIMLELEGEPTFDLTDIRTRFIETPWFRLLNDQMESEIYFGQLKQWIQTRCIDEPTPYRRELTEPTQIFLRWIKELLPDEFKVDRPRHSERLHRV